MTHDPEMMPELVVAVTVGEVFDDVCRCSVVLVDRASW